MGKLKRSKLTNQFIFEHGVLLNDNPCDVNPDTNDVESNGCIEAMYLFRNARYTLFLDFQRTKVYHPRAKAQFANCLFSLHEINRAEINV